jgi:hypothetical protein
MPADLRVWQRVARQLATRLTTRLARRLTDGPGGRLTRLGCAKGWLERAVAGLARRLARRLTAGWDDG